MFKQIIQYILIVIILSLSGLIVFLGNRINSLSKESEKSPIKVVLIDKQIDSPLRDQSPSQNSIGSQSSYTSGNSGNKLSEVDTDNLIKSEYVLGSNLSTSTSIQNSESTMNSLKKSQDSNTITKQESNTATTPNNQLKDQIIEILGEDAPKYSLYYHNLKTGEKLEINGDTLRPPASISKFPSAILTLKSIEEGEFSWDTTIQMNPEFKYIPEDPMYAYQDYAYYGIGEYIYNVIVGSDNTAIRHLEDLHGGVTGYKQKLHDKTGIKLVRQPHEILARDIGYAFEGIYNQSFLNKENNDYLIKLLSTNHRWNSDRLVLAMSKYSEAKVVHKIGQVTTTNGISYHDAGIIYGPKSDMILVILNEDTTAGGGITKIINISRLLYNRDNG